MKYLWTGMALKYRKYVNADLQYQMKLFKQLGRSFSLQSPLTKHNWYCAVGFLINTAPLNVYFILHYCLFFRTDFFLSVYISVNTIFECSYLFFGWEVGHPLSTHKTGGMKGGHPRWNIFSCFYLMVSCFICKNLTLPLFKKDCLCRKWLFFSNEINLCCHEISFFTLNSISGQKLGKTLLILVK